MVVLKNFFRELEENVKNIIDIENTFENVFRYIYLYNVMSFFIWNY